MNESPWHFDSAVTLLERCNASSSSIAEVALRREAVASGRPVADLLGKMRQHYLTMRESIRRGLEAQTRSASGLSGGDAHRLFGYATSVNPLLGSAVGRAAA